MERRRRDGRVLKEEEELPEGGGEDEWEVEVEKGEEENGGEEEEEEEGGMGKEREAKVKEVFWSCMATAEVSDIPGRFCNTPAPPVCTNSSR